MDSWLLELLTHMTRGEHPVLQSVRQQLPTLRAYRSSYLGNDISFRDPSGPGEVGALQIIHDCAVRFKGQTSSFFVTTNIINGTLSSLVFASADDHDIPEHPEIERMSYTSFDKDGNRIDVEERILPWAVIDI